MVIDMHKKRVFDDFYRMSTIFYLLWTAFWSSMNKASVFQKNFYIDVTSWPPRRLHFNYFIKDLARHYKMSHSIFFLSSCWKYIYYPSQATENILSHDTHILVDWWLRAHFCPFSPRRIEVTNRLWHLP